MKVRVISGAVLAVIAVSALLTGSWYLYFLCLFISLVGMNELYKVIDRQKSAIAIVGYTGAVFYYMSIVLNMEKYSMLILCAALMAMMAVYVFTFPKFKAEETMLIFFGLFYVAVMLSYIYKLRIMDNGIFIVWLAFIASWGNDTCAYFSGVLFGKHKMSPKLSPKKTVEGAIGGILGTTVLGCIYGFAVAPKMSEMPISPVITFAVASFAGAFLAIVGDLAASAIKRNHNVKDYGKLIPGHGGILDRFDSVIFTAPAVYWAVYVINNIM